MTKTYALKRLLEHGPMTAKEIAECTRWGSKAVHSTLDCLLESGLVERKSGKYIAEIANWAGVVEQLKNA